MARSDRESELELVRGLTAGRTECVDAFARIAGASIWAAVVVIEGHGAAGEAAFRRVLEAFKADGFRLLETFDGRAELSVFLKLLARQVLLDDIAASFTAAPQRAWPRFERAFGRDIRKRVARRFPRAHSSHDDLYQEVCLRLAEEDCRRLRDFDGRGRFETYVFVLVDRMLIDLMRKERSRRRLPVAVAAMPALEQAVFVEVAWNGAPADAARICAALAPRFDALSEFEAARALAAVRAAIDKARSAATSAETSIDEAIEGGLEFADGAPDPEQQLLSQETEAARAAFLAAIRAEAELMAPDERAYVSLILSSTDPAPPRELARRMGRRVEDIRRIHARVLRRLQQLPAARKLAALSVLSRNEEHSDG
jgi:RNA polymerase primary sigma factor